jgi:hypothetical protein
MTTTACRHDRGRQFGRHRNFRQEEDAEVYAESIAADDDPVMSAANLVEISIVLRGL